MSSISSSDGSEEMGTPPPHFYLEPHIIETHNPPTAHCSLFDPEGRRHLHHTLQELTEVDEDEDLLPFEDDFSDIQSQASCEDPQAHLTFLSIGPSHRASVEDRAEVIARRVWDAGWTVVHHHHLPKWLRDNDFLIKGHRPPLCSFKHCLKSVFRIHTETANIWTHLLAMVAFCGSASYFLSRPSIDVQWQEKAVYAAFFVGAICCFGCSWIFHTFQCHSETVARNFNKLDYLGISVLTMGSFVPWLYYTYYCRTIPKVAYNMLILLLGIACIIVCMFDKFAAPRFRPLRAGVFISLGLSGVIPTLHYIITDGFYHAMYDVALGWLALMAFLYIFGAIIYALRVPERIWPGKFDIWFQSHTIFHCFAIAAAYVHLHGISEVATFRLTNGDCVD